MDKIALKAHYSTLIQTLIRDELSDLLSITEFTPTSTHLTRLASRMEHLVDRILQRAVAFAQFRTKETKKTPPLLLVDLEQAWKSIQNDMVA